MGKVIGRIMRSIRDWRDRKDGTLRQRLDRLSPRAKVATVLGMFAAFAACALCMFGTAIYRLGQDDGRRIGIEHIRPLDLHRKKDSINPLKQYDNGTGQESGRAGTCGKTGEETETADGRTAPEA